MGAHHFWATSVALDMLPYIVVSSLTPYSSLILFPLMVLGVAGWPSLWALGPEKLDVKYWPCCLPAV